MGPGVYICIKTPNNKGKEAKVVQTKEKTIQAKSKTLTQDSVDHMKTNFYSLTTSTFADTHRMDPHAHTQTFLSSICSKFCIGEGR